MQKEKSIQHLQRDCRALQECKLQFRGMHSVPDWRYLREDPLISDICQKEGNPGKHF